MSFSRPIQWYHSHAGPIWLDGTFKVLSNISGFSKSAFKRYAYFADIFTI